MPVTGYPLSTDPNAPYPPPPIYPNPPPYSYSSPRAATLFSRFVFTMVAFLVVTVGAVFFIMWLVLRPRTPEFRVDSLSATSFNLSSSSVTGRWDVGFTITNPNKKMSVSYDRVESSLYYHWAFLAASPLPPFRQPTRNRTAVSASFAASAAYIDPPVADGLSADRSLGSVRFAVRLLARVSFRAGAWRPRRRLLRVLCRDLVVNFPANSSAGKLAGGSRECWVGL